MHRKTEQFINKVTMIKKWMPSGLQWIRLKSNMAAVLSCDLAKPHKSLIFQSFLPVVCRSILLSAWADCRGGELLKSTDRKLQVKPQFVSPPLPKCKSMVVL